jgi:hypothetical protein
MKFLKTRYVDHATEETRDLLINIDHIETIECDVPVTFDGKTRRVDIVRLNRTIKHVKDHETREKVVSYLFAGQQSVALRVVFSGTAHPSLTDLISRDVVDLKAVYERVVQALGKPGPQVVPPPPTPINVVPEPPHAAPGLPERDDDDMARLNAAKIHTASLAVTPRVAHQLAASEPKPSTPPTPRLNVTKIRERTQE